MVEGTLGFVGFGMCEFCAEGEGGGETLAGEFGLAEAEMGDAAEVQGIGLTPGVLAFGMLGEVEGVTGGLESFLILVGGKVGPCEGDADIAGILAESTAVGEDDTGFAFGDGSREIAQVNGEFAGGLKTA